MKNHRSAWLVYSALRLLFFAVPFALVYVLCIVIGLSMMLSALVAVVLAALISLSLSVLLLSKPRDAASESIYAWRTKGREHDDIVEDEAIDEADRAQTIRDAEAAEATEAAGPSDGNGSADPAARA
ncbi:MAG: DUF4229 domain-containing protein [Leucobacter sp.]